VKGGTLDRTRSPEPGPVRPFDFPRVTRERLGDGDTPALVTARHGVTPLVSAKVVVEGGAACEPATRGGIARLTADSLQAGTDTHDEEALAWELESLGVQLETATSWDAAAAGITVPADRLEPAMALLSEIVRRAAFPEGPVSRIRDEQLADILQRSKEPRALAADAAARFIFHPDVPFSRPLIGRAESVRDVDPDELRAFHRACYRAGSAAVIVTGAVDHERARAVVEEHFGDWRGEPATTPEFDVRPRVDETRVFLVHRPGSVQSEIRLGHVGVHRHHPDYFPLTVMNTILGGSFTSRLNMNLRERQGFTYGARSSFAFRRRPGPFTVDVAVASDVTARAIEEALREIRQLREEGPTADELDSARDYLRGVMPLKLQTTTQLASRLAELFVFDLPDDYFDSYRDRIAAVTREDVLRVARETIRPDRLAVVVVGDARHVEEPIRQLELGPVEVHESLP
jgi:zinc protease